MTKRINKITAIQLISTSKGKFFTVTFTKKDNTTRTINGNFKYSKSNPSKLGYLTIYSAKDKGYKNVNSQTIESLSINGTTYRVS